MQEYVVLSHPHLGLGLFLNHVYTAQELFRRCEGDALIEKKLEDILFDDGRQHFKAVHADLPFFQPPKLRSEPKHNKGRERTAEEPAKKRRRGDYTEWRDPLMWYYSRRVACAEDLQPFHLSGCTHPHPV